MLRHWRAADRAPFAAMNADPAVMAFFPAPLSRAESDAFADAIAAHHAARGFGLWALGSRASRRSRVRRPQRAGFLRAVHAVRRDGCRLAAAHWGRGHATEAARAVLAHAWDVVGLDEVVSFTTADNARSRAVMTRLGMRYDPTDDFDHPKLPPGHPLRRHVLYRVAHP